MLEGWLQRLEIEAGAPARYELVVAGDSAEANTAEDILPLNPFVGSHLRIEFNGRITCSACGAPTRRSYGEGHCYRCFRRLAACDLCVVSPVRCHYAQGTCREPAWGEAFCMRPHLVYLANTSGAKVGITTQGGQLARWLDQGATQGLVIARAATRHLAGVLEDRLARRVSDRTDWRALLSRDANPIDLPGLKGLLRETAGPLPAGVAWVEDEPVTVLRYPVQSYPRRLMRLRLEETGTVSGRLLGIKGQYLLFEHGVLNVRRHRSFHVQVRAADAAEPVLPGGAASVAAATAGYSQMELFSE